MVDNVMVNPKMLAEAKAIDIYTNCSLIVKNMYQSKRTVFIITVLTKNTYLHT